MKRRTRLFWIMALCASNVLIGACITASKNTPTETQPVEAKDNGLKFNHAIHAEQQLECDICHGIEEGVPAMPTHDTCSACHDLNVDQPSPEQCGFCHTREDYSKDERIKPLSEELKFAHDPHIAKEVACATCHENPDVMPLVDQPLKPFCMDCHGKTDPQLNECAVCHTSTSRDTIPQFRQGKRIQHDAPQIWTQLHGKESQVDPEYCMVCHDLEQTCDTCHQTTAPANHTVSWKRKTHGMKASWDRSDCTVCHEEESCLQCHRNTKPDSHRQGWGQPMDRHCTSCHFPPNRTNCVVCHEVIEHQTAAPSPHRLGIYPPNCIQCHPGGLSGRAPHPTNSTARCEMCH